jgi:glycogen(starch) synthase
MPVRVLCVGNMYPPHDLGGGYEITFRSSVLHLRSHGHEVRVLTTDFGSADLDAHAELDDDVHRELRWYWSDHAFPRRSIRERIAIERHNADVLDRHLRSLHPDVVAWWGMGGMSLSLVERVRRAGLPAVGVVGDEWLRWGPRADRWLAPVRRSRPLARVAEALTGLPAHVDFDGAATWLFNSEAMRANARRDRALPRSEVAHPGIDEELFRPAPPRTWSWSLLYLGRIDERKGIHLAVDALSALPKSASLTIQGSGDPDYARRLRERATRQGVEDRIVYSRQPRKRLPAVYAAADVVLFPVQWEEPWGLVPLEAMAVGRPVVASGTGGSREYLRHEVNCLLYEPHDSYEMLADAVQRLAGDEALRAHIVEGGMKTAAAFTETAYNEAIERSLASAVRT